jgi:ABC-type Zn uptake system ZnuABC Zn-binding protein ZnuA
MEAEMKTFSKFSKLVLIILTFFTTLLAQGKINVVTTLSVYADITKQIARNRATVEYIVPGDQDAHFVRPKPSYAVKLSNADMFVTTGLDLELWVPSVVDMSKNNKIRSGQSGYVAAYDGIELLDKPSVLSRSEGGLHIYGNPHITTSPLNFKIIAENITIGLEKLEPDNSSFYQENLKTFKQKMDNKVFGEELVKLMGGNLLTKLANSGQLIDFLSTKKYKGRKMIDYLGGWMKKGMVFRNKKIVAYHKNWIYFKNLFGLDIIGYVEPKPGIPPSPKHVEQLVNKMRENNITVILAANYFDENKVKRICTKVGATPIIVPIYVDGAPNTEDVFKLTDLWIDQLTKAFE